jgi:hypothetical protein
MKIEESNINLKSNRKFINSESLFETLKIFSGTRKEDRTDSKSLVSQGSGDSIDLSALIKRGILEFESDQLNKIIDSNIDKTKEQQKIQEEHLLLNSEHGWQLQIIAFAFEKLTGTKLDLSAIFDSKKYTNQTDETAEDFARLNANRPSDAAANEQDFVLEYDRRMMIYEKETTKFSAEGTIQTADGQSISFKLNFEMSREYMEERNISIRAGSDMKDPLVVNFAGTAASLNTSTFSFDINSDGKSENLPSLNAGSGFLALDKNNNNQIDNGNELFGTKSGNGFADLREYDSDKNNWIDESDPVYGRLGIFNKSNDLTRFSSLMDKKIGAIYLGNTETQFGLRSQNNKPLGEVVSSGVFLDTYGKAGTVQQ